MSWLLKLPEALENERYQSPEQIVYLSPLHTYDQYITRKLELRIIK